MACACYVAELVLSLAARGFFKGPHAYFKSSWRVSDFIIVMIALASTIAGGGQIRSLRALRAARALRPLRLVARFPQLQVRWKRRVCVPGVYF